MHLTWERRSDERPQRLTGSRLITASGRGRYPAGRRRQQNRPRHGHSQQAGPRPAGHLWSLALMNHKIAGSIAAVAVLALGAAACGSSPSSKGSATATGKPLTIVTTELSPMTDTFNPFAQT